MQYSKHHIQEVTLSNVGAPCAMGPTIHLLAHSGIQAPGKIRDGSPACMSHRQSCHFGVMNRPVRVPVAADRRCGYA